MNSFDRKCYIRKLRQIGEIEVRPKILLHVAILAPFGIYISTSSRRAPVVSPAIDQGRTDASSNIYKNTDI